MQSWGRWVYNARYYDPILSRFISADSVSGGNRYTYVSNNPISNSDPSGNVMTAGDGGGGGGGAPQEGGQKSPFGQIPAYTYTPSINTAQVGNTGVINGIWGGSSAYSTQGQTWTSEAAGYNCPPGKDCGHDALPISTLVGGFGLGFPCALGFLPSCVMTNALLASAWGQQIASNGQSNSLTAPALVASSVAIGGQMAIQGGQAVRGAIQSRIDARNAVMQTRAAINEVTETARDLIRMGRYEEASKYLQNPTTFSSAGAIKESANMVILDQAPLADEIDDIANSVAYHSHNNGDGRMKLSGVLFWNGEPGFTATMPPRLAREVATVNLEEWLHYRQDFWGIQAGLSPEADIVSRLYQMRIPVSPLFISRYQERASVLRPQ